MSKFSVKYKVREGDTYENLFQRFGAALTKAGIYSDEDLVNNKEFNLGVNTREEAELLQKKDLEYQKKIQRDKDLAYINKNRAWLEEQNFFQGGEELTDDQMIERYRRIYKSGKEEERDREASRKELNEKLESGMIDAKYNRMARQAGVINEHTAKFSPQMRYHNDRKEYLQKNGNQGIIGRGLTLNGNEELSFQNSQQNLQDQAQLGQDLQSALYTVGAGTVAAPFAGATGTIGKVLSSKPVSLGLGAHGIYDASTDMYRNGVNLSNSLELAGSLIPFGRYTKLGKYADDIMSNSKIGKYFSQDEIKAISDRLAATQKESPVPLKQRLELLARYNASKFATGTANIIQDMAAGTSGSRLGQNANEVIDRAWNYTYDENGNIIKDSNYYTREGIRSALNTLGFTLGIGARTGNTARSLATGTLAYGPGTDLIYKGLDTVEDKFGLKGNKIWDPSRRAAELIAPVLLQRGLDRGITFGKQRLGKELSDVDRQIINTTNRDAIVDTFIEEGIGMPLASGMYSLLPEDVQDNGTLQQLASMIGSRINPRQKLARALEGTAGAQKYNLVTVGRVLENLAAGDMPRYRYTGTYENNDSYMLGSTQHGSIYGVEGANKNAKGKGTFNRYDQSLGRNFSQRKEEALPISWWNLFSGSYNPTVGERFNDDSKIVRYDSDYKGKNDLASTMASGEKDGRRLVEIRNNSRLLGDADVPQGLQSGLIFGIPRSDGYFTGVNGTALNTVGANGVLYKDNTGSLKGVQVVDYTNPGVRRIQPSNTAFGKFAYLLAHPQKALKDPKSWLKKQEGKTKEGDNYYNKEDQEKGIKGDLAYIGTSWATSLVGGLQRNKVFSTTGYKSLSDIDEQGYMNSGYRKLLFDPENIGKKMPSVSEITKFYKGTDLESATFGEKLEGFVNEMNRYEGKNLGEKYENYVKLGNVGNKPEKSKKLKKERKPKVVITKEQKTRSNNETQMEKWLSRKNQSKVYYTKDGKIDRQKLEKVFHPKKNTAIKEVYYLGLPKDVQDFIKKKYKFTLYKKGGNL